MTFSWQFKLTQGLLDSFERKSNSSVEIQGEHVPIKYIDRSDMHASEARYHGIIWATQNLRKGSSPWTQKVLANPKLHYVWAWHNNAGRRFITRITSTDDPEKASRQLVHTKLPDNRVINSVTIPLEDIKPKEMEA